MPLTGHIISHTHWDREWFLTSKYTAEWLRPFFDSLFNMLEKYPEYCFVLDGQAILIDDYLEQLSPSEKAVSKEKLKKYISQSRLLAGPYYLQPDWRLVNGESLVRNMMLGHQMTRSYGGVMKAGWLLDNFGQISQAPQIHQGFGINGVYLWRGLDVDPENIYSEYLWESPDGTEVTSIYLLNSYRNAMRLAEYADIAQQRLDNETQKLTGFATTDNVLLMNGYDQEMVPDDVLPLIEQVNANSNGIQLVQTTPIKYLQTIQKANPVLQQLKGAQNSGRFISVFPGTLSARMYLKQMNSACENLLTKWTEPVSTWLWLLGGEYPKTLIDSAWKELLQNHPHDNICGVSIDDVHSDMEVRYTRSKEVSAKIIEQTLLTLSSNINTENEHSLVVFNPRPRKTDAIIKTTLKIDTNFSICESGTGRVVSHQVGEENSDSKDVYFLANSIPGLGYKTFYLSPKKTEPSLTDVVIVSVKERRMENKYLKVQIESNGSVTVKDKSTGQIFESIAYFEDGADSGDTYNYSYPEQDTVLSSLNSKARTTILEQGPLAAKYKIEISMALPIALNNNRKKRSKKTRSVSIVTFVELRANSQQLEFHTQLINTVKDHRLRVVFPTLLETDSSFSDSPFDVVQNPVSFPQFQQELPDNIKKIIIGARESVSGTSLPLSSFVYLKDQQENGAALLTRGLNEYEILEKHKIALTLFRSVGWLARPDLLTRTGDAGPMIYTPEAQCLRRFDFHYSFLPFQNKTNGFFFEQTEQFNNDLKVVSTGKHKGALDSESGFFYLNKEKNPLIISAVKKDEIEDALIIRLFNPSEQANHGEIIFKEKILQADLVNLNEEQQSSPSFNEKSIIVKVPSKKIVTVRLRFKRKNSLTRIQPSGVTFLQVANTDMENDLNVNVPAIITEEEIKQEEERAEQLKRNLIISLKEQKLIEIRIAETEDKKVLKKLIKEKNNILGVVTTLTRAELEARLSFVLAQKKYVELYESDKQEIDKRLKSYDSTIRTIGLALNTARVDKRVAEYLSELYRFELPDTSI